MKEGRTKKGIWLLGQISEKMHVRIRLKSVDSYSMSNNELTFIHGETKIKTTFIFENELAAQKADEKICDVLEKGVDEGEECIYLEYKTVK